jgi:hypothetical protein
MTAGEERAEGSALAGDGGVTGSSEPVRGGFSRRRFLVAVAAVGGTAAAGAVLWNAIQGDDEDTAERTDAEPTLDAAAEVPVTRTLHFSLGHHQDLQAPKLHVAGVRYDLKPHDQGTRQTLLASAPYFVGLDAALLTHYATDVVLPPVVVAMNTYDGVGEDGNLVVGTRWLSSKIHYPTNALVRTWEDTALAEAALAGLAEDPQLRQTVEDAAVGLATVADVRAALAQLGAAPVGAMGGSVGRWERLGFTSNTAPKTVAAAQALLAVSDAAMDTAVALVIRHPEILNFDPTGASLSHDILYGSPKVRQLAAEIEKEARANPTPLGTFVGLTTPEGQPLTFPDGIATADGTMPTGQMLSMQRNGALEAATAAAVTEVIGQVKDHQALQGYNWNVTPSALPAVVEPAAGLEAAATIGVTGDCSPNATSGIKVTSRGKQGSGDDLSVGITILNDYLRHCAVMVSFHGATGKGIRIPPDFDYGASLPYTFLSEGTSNDFCKLLFLMPSAPTILGITEPGRNTQDLTINFPPGASTARVYVGSMGAQVTANALPTKLVDEGGKPVFPGNLMPPLTWYGVAMFLIMDLGLPSYQLFTATRDLTNANLSIYKGIWNGEALSAEDVGAEFAEISKNLTKYAGAAGAVAATVITAGAVGSEIKRVDVGATGWRMLKDASVDILKLLGNKKLAKLVWTKMLQNQATSEALDAIPFLGDAFAAISAIENAAKLATSTVELMISQPVTITDVNATQTWAVTVLPDPGDSTEPGSEFLPKPAKRLEVTYQVAGQQPVQVVAVDHDFADGETSFPVNVPNMALLGQIQWTARFLTAEGGVVGTGATNWLPLEGDPKVDLPIKEVTIPITDKTVFAREWTTAAKAGKVGPGSKDRPEGTVLTMPATGITELDGVTTATRLGMVGYVWGIEGQYYVQSLAAGTDMGARWNSAGPFPRRPLLAYDTLTADPAGARNYLLDPSGDAGYHVRAVSPGPGNGSATLVPDRSTSYGWFAIDLTDVAYHPAGYLVGVSATSGRLSVLQVSPTAGDPAFAPKSAHFAGKGTREGLLAAPAFVTCLPGGIVVVLDNGASAQLRAFGIDGAPAPHFGGQSAVALQGGDSRAFVGLACDGGSALYVLSYSDEQDPDSWVLDVYDQSGAHVLAQPGVNSGRLAVDFWQSVYTVNYVPIFDEAAKAFVDPAIGVVQPSVTEWTIA